MNDQKEYARVEKIVEEKMGFYIHLATYIVVNALLITINLITSPGEYWFVWPFFGWAIGLVLHGLNVFVLGGGTALRERMIDAEMKKAGF